MSSLSEKKPHLYLKAHVGGERYLELDGLKPKKLIVEDGSGASYENPYQFFQKVKDNVADSQVNGTRYQRSKWPLLFESMNSGMTVVPGELFQTEAERERYLGMLDELPKLQDRMFRQPTVDHMKETFKAVADLYSLRHRIIVNTVKDFGDDGPLVLRYGSDHSLLSLDLRRAGIKTTRTVDFAVFKKSTELIRRLHLDPEARISERDYKMAYLCSLNEVMGLNQAMNGKATGKLTNIDLMRTSLVERSLLEASTDEQLDRIIQTQDLTLLFTQKGFESPAAEPISPRRQMEILEALNAQNPKTVSSRFFRYISDARKKTYFQVA